MNRIICIDENHLKEILSDLYVAGFTCGKDNNLSEEHYCIKEVEISTAINKIIKN